MPTHRQAVDAYKTLAKYMNCYPRAEKCPKCLFHMDYGVCLVQRLGTYPELALEKEDIEELEINLKRLDGEEKCKSQ